MSKWYNTVSGSSLNSSSLAAGIVVRNSGTSYNEVYKNTLVNINYGIQAVGDNRASLANNSTGLKFLCNNGSSNTVKTAYDLSVVPDWTNPTSTTGIAGRQSKQTGATLDGPVGNLFKPVFFPFSPNSYSFYNSCQSSGYYYGLSAAELPIKRSGITVFATSIAATCPTKYDIINTVSPIITKSNLVTIKAQIGIDISTGLIGVGSDDDNLFSTYRLGNDTLIDSYLYSDSLVDMDAVAEVLDSTGHVYDYKLQLASLYIQQARHGDAYSLLDGLSSSYSLESQEVTGVNNLNDIYHILQFVDTNAAGWSGLNTTQLNTIYDIDTTDLGYAAAVSHYLLSRYENMQYEPRWRPIDSVTQLPLNRQTLEIKSQQRKGTIVTYPNPTHSEFVLSTIDMEADVAIVSDMQGRVISSTNLHNGNNTIDMRHALTGIYLIRVYNKGKCVQTSKVSKY